MTEDRNNAVWDWIRKYQNLDLKEEGILRDIEASSARVSGLAEHVVHSMEFGTEPAGYAALLDGLGEEADENEL